MSADRELVAHVEINAKPDQVWSVLTDFKRMSEWSPELVSMLALKRGGLRVGQWYLGINRRKALVWPTRNVVVDVVPGERLAWDTTSSGARWIYELTPSEAGTSLTQRRPVPTKLTRVSGLVAGSLLGGAESHADELEDGMSATLEGIKAACERG